MFAFKDPILLCSFLIERDQEASIAERFRLVFPFLACMMICEPAFAQSYCPEGADGYPDGNIRTYEDTTLRICDDTDWKVVSVDLNKEAVPDLENDRALLALSIRFQREQLPEDAIGSGRGFIYWHLDTDVEHGGLKYERWIPKLKTGNSESFNVSTLVSHGDLETPAHYVTCYGESDPDGGTCFVRILFQDITAKVTLIGGLEQNGPVSKDDFPSLARSILTILNYMSNSVR